MDKDILVKRGPGRPIGSKDTKSRKPYVRTAFAYSQKQSDYIKYIIRKDKKITETRLKGASKRMEYLRHSSPAIPENRMQKLEKWFLKMCSDYQESLETAPSTPRYVVRRKSVKERKNVQIISELNNSEKVSIKKLTFNSIDLPSDRKLRKIGKVMARRWKITAAEIKSADDFLFYVGFSGIQRLETRSAYEAWMIRTSRPDIDVLPLLRSLLQLNATYYKNRYEKGDEKVQSLFVPKDFRIVNGVSNSILEATKDFYSLLSDFTPKHFSLRALYGLNQLIDMEEWNYTFDFLYGLSGKSIPLICIYHGETNSIRGKHSLECPLCRIEQEKRFTRLVEKQNEEAMNVLDDEKADFIAKAHEAHGDKYDYSLVDFVNWNRPVKIRCKKHDFVFEISPTDHVKGRGCKKCAHNQKKTNEEFIEELRAIYGDSMDYSLVRYVNNKTNVVCVCKKHHEPVVRTPLNLLKGWGCSLCMKEAGKTWNDVVASNYNKGTRVSAFTKEQFISKAQKVHGDKYDYSQVKYFNNDTAVIIQCKKCGREFPVTPTSHLRGYGVCSYCYGNKGDHSENIRTQVFISRANKIHGNRYVYLDKVMYPDEKVHIMCNIHGEFTMLPKDHLAGFGCPQCFPEQNVPSGISYGETKVMEYLDSIGVDYVYNKSIPNKYHLSNREHLRPDFQLLDESAIIEFNGEQHYRFVEGLHITEERFHQQQLRDEEMRMWCKDNNIKLLEIRYDEVDKIPALISEFLAK